MTLTEILQGANVALQLIQERLVVILCLLLTFALFCWAMWLQTIIAAILCCAWGLTIFLPVLFAGSRGAAVHEEAPEHPAQPQ